MRAFEARWRSLPGAAPGLAQHWPLRWPARAPASILVGRRLDRLELVAAKARETGADAACCSADLSSSSDLLEVDPSHPKFDLSALTSLIQNAADLRCGIDRGRGPFGLGQTISRQMCAPLRLDASFTADAESVSGTGRFHQFEQRLKCKADDGAV